MDMVDAGVASSMDIHWSGKTTLVPFMMASDQWEHKQNGQLLRNQTSEPVSAPGDWRS
jgi:hypothetical protein